MRFVDFAVAIGPPAVERRDVNLRYTAFSVAVTEQLRPMKLLAPWTKLHVEFQEGLTEHLWTPSLPKVGLSSAGPTIPVPDFRLTTVGGEDIRSVLAENVAATRHIIRDRSDWDDPAFWDLVARVGAPIAARIGIVCDPRSIDEPTCATP